MELKEESKETPNNNKNVTLDILPNHTLYINNLNEKIKKSRERASRDL